MNAQMPRILKTLSRGCLLWLACWTALTGLSGCGQKGALYLPSSASPASAASASAAAPANR